jgi:hypothetical protein
VDQFAGQFEPNHVVAMAYATERRWHAESTVAPAAPHPAAARPPSAAVDALLLCPPVSRVETRIPYLFLRRFLRSRKSWRQDDTPVAHAASHGLATTVLVSVGSRPRSRPAGFLPPLHATAGCTTPGLRLRR